ncbi:MAG: ECF-type sigma factor [Pirellulaceae bacterium]
MIQSLTGGFSPASSAMCDVTRILGQIESGDPSAAEQLLPLVYEELRKLAAAKMAHERPGQTLQATALVHEAYIRLVDTETAQHWDSRRHFFAAAGEAMRRILVEQARRKTGPRNGGTYRRVELSSVETEWPAPRPDLLALNESLEKLERQDPRAAQLVKLRFFVGMTNDQAAQSLGISAATAKTDWAYAKCWLRAELLDNSPIG